MDRYLTDQISGGLYVLMRGWDKSSSPVLSAGIRGRIYFVLDEMRQRWDSTEFQGGAMMHINRSEMTRLKRKKYVLDYAKEALSQMGIVPHEESDLGKGDFGLVFWNPMGFVQTLKPKAPMEIDLLRVDAIDKKHLKVSCVELVSAYHGDYRIMPSTTLTGIPVGVEIEAGRFMVSRPLGEIKGRSSRTGPLSP